MIIVTGASDGLGANILSAAQDSGFEVMNISRHSNKAADMNVEADLSTDDGIKSAVNKIKAVEGATALVLNAGALSLGPFEKMDGREFDRVIAVNLRAPLLMLAALKGWIIASNVDVVIINSISGIRSFKEQTIYDVSKWGLRGLTEDLRLELDGTASRVMGVYPGMLDTEMATKLPSGPMPKSKKPLIESERLARIIVDAITLPKQMQLTDIIIDRKVQ